MDLTVTKAAQTFLKEKVADKSLYLDFIDGDSPGYEGAISCALGVSFRLLLVNEPGEYPVLEKFTTSVMTPLGVFKIKESSKMYLEDEMMLDFNQTYHRLQLNGRSGVITDNVVVATL